ncbi:hypothetical protein Trydic_g3460 [Trypoxylus dichotomus]
MLVLLSVSAGRFKLLLVGYLKKLRVSLDDPIKFVRYRVVSDHVSSTVRFSAKGRKYRFTAQCVTRTQSAYNIRSCEIVHRNEPAALDDTIGIPLCLIENRLESAHRERDPRSKDVFIQVPAVSGLAGVNPYPNTRRITTRSRNTSICVSITLRLRSQPETFSYGGHRTACENHEPTSNT